MQTGEAIRLAKERGVDVVEVAPTASPPVCRLMDYGKFKYEQAKKKKEARKNQHEVVLREVRMKPKIDNHDVEFKTRMVRKLIDGGDKVKVTMRFRGREIDTAGDGLFATFDGPARAVRCAEAIGAAARLLSIEIRAGLHTGEVEVMGDKVGGIAVHIGARVASQAGPGEVLVSSTVKDLVAGSGLRFQDRGAHALKGVPGEWQLFAVAAAR